MIQETWKLIDGTGGKYFVSDCGNVRSCFHGKLRDLKKVRNSKGYYRVLICTPVRRQRLVHRLVAEAFLERPEGFDVVNHKDFNPLNNCASNLEWTTNLGNTRYSLERGRYKRTEEWVSKLKSSLDKKMGKPVVGTNIETGEKFYYRALNDCAKDGFQPSCVSLCSNGKQKSHKGFLWRFSDA